uniref:Major facilitator superfamily (MFS_1) transporter n=1 Tax=mine drainage metagenome TaxID=410659 RepID=E6QHE3_9ZZZZ
MNRSFYLILIAQFFSALADNALLFAAIALLKLMSAPQWHEPLLREFFVVAYILLAPFVGALADAYPKGRVMLLSNTIKLAGCMAMLLGIPPLYAYAIVGTGAAAYSPAKYGILTEILPPGLLVTANSWMEGSTVVAIILGFIAGGVLSSVDPFFAIKMIVGFYLIAAFFNLFIPHVPIDHKLPKRNPAFVLHDFWHVFKLLWKDEQGKVSLAVTTLFWGVGATLQFVVIGWSSQVLDFSVKESGYLMAIVAFGIAVGSLLAARFIKLEHAIKSLPAGIMMGLLVVSISFMGSWKIASIALFFIGALGGFFVVPLNALLQHRGHVLMGAGHSIAVQNFNENIGILILLGCYAGMVRSAMNIDWIIVLFGLFISSTMALIYGYSRKRL